MDSEKEDPASVNYWHIPRLLSFIENYGNVDVIYLDFSKSFDRIDLKILLYKIKKRNQ